MKKLVFISLIMSSVLLPNLTIAQRIDKEIPENSLIYALPKTVIEISIEVRKDKYVPGPYVRSATTHLSIESVSSREEITYSIGKILMKPVVEADYEYLYSLPIGEKTLTDASFLSLSSEGLIFSINGQKEIGANLSSSTPKNYMLYPDQLPSSPMETQREFLIERVKTDSGFVNVPYHQSILEKKDPQSKAEEAAKFLFALRQRRFELITGDVDHAFSGTSLKDALLEINRLEKEYLSLFLGKHFIETQVYRFYVSPEKAIDSKSYAVFYFSESDGVLSESARASVPFMLNIIPSGKINNVEGVKTKVRLGGIYYRIPETATVQLFFDSQEVCSSRMQIYQLGKELILPSDMKIK
jgi:hypothetical protein